MKCKDILTVKDRLSAGLIMGITSKTLFRKTKSSYQI